MEFKGRRPQEWNWGAWPPAVRSNDFFTKHYISRMPQEFHFIGEIFSVFVSSHFFIKIYLKIFEILQKSQTIRSLQGKQTSIEILKVFPMINSISYFFQNVIGEKCFTKETLASMTKGEAAPCGPLKRCYKAGLNIVDRLKYVMYKLYI